MRGFIDEDDELLSEFRRNAKENAEQSEEMVDPELVKLRRQQVLTAMAEVKLAENLGVVIPRDMVDKAFNHLRSVITDRFLSFAVRLAPLICAELKVESPENTVKVRDLIGTEVEKSIKAIKRLGLDLLEKDREKALSK